MRSVITLAVGALLLAALIAMFGASAARAAARTPPEQDAPAAPASVDAVGLAIDIKANTSFTRTYIWEITKTVNAAGLSLFAGQSAPVVYTVHALRDDPTSGYTITGTVRLHNPDPADIAVILAVVVDLVPGDSVPAPCEGVTAYPHTIAAGATLTCTFSAPIAGINTFPTASVTIFSAGPVGGGTASYTTISTERVQIDAGSKSVRILDPLIPTGGKPLTNSSVFTYTNLLNCPTAQAQYTAGVNTATVSNTATISQTGQSSTAGVALNCYAPDLAQTANTSFRREWNWSINKKGDVSTVTVGQGQPIAVKYDVDVTNSLSDSEFALTGVISVHNPHPAATMNLSLTGAISPGVALALSCANPLSVAPGATVACDYTVGELDDGTTRQTVATAVLNGLKFTSSREAVFDNPSQELDECVDVFDNNGTPDNPADDFELGAVCRDAAPKTFTYAEALVGACPLRRYVNTARLAGSDTANLGVSSWTVTLNGAGCPLSLRVLLPLVER
jgi:hypothetical protein